MFLLFQTDVKQREQDVDIYVHRDAIESGFFFGIAFEPYYSGRIPFGVQFDHLYHGSQYLVHIAVVGNCRSLLVFGVKVTKVQVKDAWLFLADKSDLPGRRAGNAFGGKLEGAEVRPGF